MGNNYVLRVIFSVNCSINFGNGCALEMSDVYHDGHAIVCWCRDPTHTLLFLGAIRKAYQH